MYISFFKISFFCVLWASVALVFLPTQAVASSTTHFIPGFVTLQGVDIPTLNANTLVTKIIGKFGGGSVKNGLIDFKAIKLSDNSYLAQIIQEPYKKGVFFAIDNNKIKVTQARYCLLTDCQNRNVALSDTYWRLAGGRKDTGYAILDMTITTESIFLSQSFVFQFIPGPITLDGTDIPALQTDTSIVSISGGFGGSSPTKLLDFKAIKLSQNSFLAQVVTNKYKEGVFLIIDGKNRLKATQTRYCLLVDCQNRNVALSDRSWAVGRRGYNLFGVTIAIKPVYFPLGSYGTFPGFVTTNAVSISNAKNKDIAVHVTGKFDGGATSYPADFTAIQLNHNSFIAQIIQGLYKKAVFFTIESNNKIKVTQARHCLLTDCQSRNVTLSDRSMPIATNQTADGYGISDLLITLLPNLAFSKTATQSSTYVDVDHQAASRAVDGYTSGNWANHSVSSTHNENNAWWQVDLGDDKLIKQIRIFNRTDCCKDRLSNYTVSILKTPQGDPVYQQHIQAYPDSEEFIDLGMQPVKGRYVKIQLLGANYLSLAEVQVIGTDVDNWNKDAAF